MKKVLFVISSLRVGGAERALAEITKHFPDDWEIDILLNGRHTINFDYRGNLLYLGIDEEPKMLSVFFHIKILYKRLLMLRRLKKTGEYKACISFLDSANVANILTKSSKCKTIISIRSSLSKQAKMPQYKYIVNPLAKLLYNQSDWIVAVSKGVGRELVEQFGLSKEKVVVIENGYDVKRLEVLGQQELTDTENAFLTGKKVITTVGRLTDAKGQWHLIRAFSRVVERIDDAALVIVGGGELEDYLINVVKQLGMSEKVLFTGNSNNPYKYLQRSDIFVLASLYEGFPNALAEAICMGVPCVATDFQSGARELLSPMLMEDMEPLKSAIKVEYGILSPCCSGHRLVEEDLENEEIELSEAIIGLLMDDDMRSHYIEMSKKRRLDLGIEAVIRKYESIIL